MKTISRILVITFVAALCSHASLTVPGANGTDGVLNITANTVIDLSLAPTGSWDQDNTANAGNGVYDPEKWAVVFKYTSVNVAAGATVTFKNHPSRAPVVWLVSGNVTIAGTVSLNGQGAVPAPLLAEPGPGGFRGGARHFDAQVGTGAGFGMGGGRRDLAGGNFTAGGGGSFGDVGTPNPSATYANPSLIPLIGGSGGGGAVGYGAYRGGGAGGGAFKICSSTTISLVGQILSNGGAGDASGAQGAGGGGSGGGVRLIASNFEGSGSIFAVGGSNLYSQGGNGRIRLERITDTSTINVIPAPSVVDLPENATALLWPPAGSPEVRVLSIGGETASADPRAAFGTLGADVALPVATSTTVIIETKNVEPESQVLVRITPRDSAHFTEVGAIRLDPPVSTDPLTYHWTATVPTTLGYAAIQARVVRP